MSENIIKIAILVDGDNAQPKLFKSIVDEVSKYGKVTVRRIYGDWTDNKMNGWKQIINDTSFTPMQKFEYTTGKNSTDGALIIDAMDILHSKTVDGFCIVSSDSDYTGLAKRIREEGLFVMGVGEKKTPTAFVQSCEIFTFCENIIPPTEQMVKVTNAKVKSEESKLSKGVIALVDKAYEMAIGDNEETLVSKMGIMLRSLDPSFDPRDYACANLSTLLKKVNGYQVVDNLKDGINHQLFKRKN